MERPREPPSEPRPPRDGPPQRIRAVNRHLLSTVASLLSEESPPSEPGEAGSKPTPRHAAGATPRLGGQASSRQEYEAAKRKKEHAARHRALLEAREEDAKRIQERRVRSMLVRDARFEGLMEGLRRDDMLRVEASKAIVEHETEHSRRCQDLYEKWDTEVSQRVERQLHKYMTGLAPEVPEGFREELFASDHPCTKDLREYQEEERFRRQAALILSGPADVQERVQVRRFAEEATATRGSSRLTLQAEEWADQRPAGASRRGEGACTAPEAAGRLRRTVPEAITLVRGQAALHKRSHGASSGAPCQDHYFYDRGNAAVDAEFPAGRRNYPHLHA